MKIIIKGCIKKKNTKQQKKKKKKKYTFELINLFIKHLFIHLFIN